MTKKYRFTDAFLAEKAVSLKPFRGALESLANRVMTAQNSPRPGRINVTWTDPGCDPSFRTYALTDLVEV